MESILTGKSKLFVTDETPFPIQPHHIDTSRHFYGAFDHNETEVSARWIVKLCQELGGWVPFTQEQIDEFSKQDFGFNELLGNWS